jgi:hypothetical protein
MTFTTLEVIEAVRGLLEGERGLSASVEELKQTYGAEERAAPAAPVVFLRAPAESQEKAWPSKYPMVHVYCDRIEGRPVERLRRFSGRVRVVAEVRVSQDRLDGITQNLHHYVDAVRDVLERNTGCVGDGLYLSSEYDVQIEPVKKGGLNYLQTARIACPVMVNRG